MKPLTPRMRTFFKMNPKRKNTQVNANPPLRSAGVMTLVYVGGPLQPLTHPARARPVEAYRRIALPLIIDRECENALSASFHQWATRRVSPNLVDRSVEVQNPVLGQEFAGT